MDIEKIKSIADSIMYEVPLGDCKPIASLFLKSIKKIGLDGNILELKEHFIDERWPEEWGDVLYKKHYLATVIEPPLIVDCTRRTGNRIFNSLHEWRENSEIKSLVKQ